MLHFANFEKEFKGDLVTPADPDYANAIIRWARNAQRNAQVVAFVKDAEDVSLAIKYAKANKLPIAVRGGGHNPMGASSVQGGLVVDLSRYINGVKVDPEPKLAFVGGGAVWETVDKNAIEHGLATVAGTVNHVCILFHDRYMFAYL
jgi:FAD/FMN-containing dehydrogenase